MESQVEIQCARVRAVENKGVTGSYKERERVSKSAQRHRNWIATFIDFRVELAALSEGQSLGSDCT